MRSTAHLAAVFCSLVISLSSALAADPSPEAQVAGQIRVARWDVILNDNGLESVDSTDNSVVHTDSVGYSGAIFNADALRAAVNAAQAVGGLEGSSQSMAYTQIYGGGMYNMQPLYFNYYQGQAMHIGLQGNAQGTETYTSADAGHVHIKLAYPQMNRQLMESDINGGWDLTELKDKASIIYDGPLAPGDAVAFSANFKGKDKVAYRHMVVWEAFKAEDRYQQHFQCVQDSERWCQMGPKTVRDDADIAFVWGSQAKHPPSTVTAKWEQKLEDGKIVRLTGVTRTDKWLYCWWDADGQTIDNSNWISLTKYYQNQPVWFSAEVSASEDEWKKQTPTNHPGFNRGEQTGTFNSNLSTVTDQNGKATVGVPVGPWEQVGEIKKGGRIRVGNITYVLRDVQANGPDFMFVQFYPDRYVPDQTNLVTLTAVGLDGTEVDPNYLPMITGKNFGIAPPNFQGFSLKNLKTFHVWKRKQQWVTFSGFATEPAITPKDHVTAAEMAVVVDAQNKSQQQAQAQAIQQQMVVMKEKRKEWDAIPADPKTPKGALRALFQAADKGDLHTVRARLTSKQTGADQMLDATAHLITAMQSARHLAVQRFGEANVESLQSANSNGMWMPIMMDLEGVLVSQPWQPRSDGGLQNGSIAITKGDNGEFFVDMSGPNQATLDQKAAAMKMAISTATQMDYLNQLMKDNPSLTLAQLRKAIAEPATQSATTRPLN